MVITLESLRVAAPQHQARQVRGRSRRRGCAVAVTDLHQVGDALHLLPERFEKLDLAASYEPGPVTQPAAVGVGHAGTRSAASGRPATSAYRALHAVADRLSRDRHLTTIVCRPMVFKCPRSEPWSTCASLLGAEYVNFGTDSASPRKSSRPGRGSIVTTLAASNAVSATSASPPSTAWPWRSAFRWRSSFPHSASEIIDPSLLKPPHACAIRKGAPRRTWRPCRPRHRPRRGRHAGRRSG